MGFPGSANGKESACQYRRLKRWGFDPWVMKIPWRRKWLPLQYSRPETHGQRSLEGYSPRGCKESDITEWLNTTYMLKVNWVWKYLKCFSWPLSWPEENQRIFKNTDFQPSYITIFLLLSQRETFHSLISPLHTHLGLSANTVLDRLPLCQPPGFLKIPSPLFPIFLHIPPLKSMLVLHACSSVCFASSQSVLISGSMPKLVR